MKNILYLLTILIIPSLSIAKQVDALTAKGSWADFQTDKAVVQSGIAEMAANYIQIPMPIDLKNFTDLQIEQLKSEVCIRKTTAEGWRFYPNSTCIRLLPEAQKQILYEFTLQQFDLYFPSYGVTVLKTEADKLKLQNFIKIHQPQLQMDSDWPATDLLPKSVSNLIWKMSVASFLGGVNCFGTAIAAEYGYSVGYIDPTSMSQYIHENAFQTILDNEDWEFGDLIVFDIPNDGHAMVYVGTDQKTQKKIVFTKNGTLASPYQTMTYDDVFAVYNKFQITGVRHFRRKQFSNMIPDLNPTPFASKIPPKKTLVEKAFQDHLNQLIKNRRVTL